MNNKREDFLKWFRKKKAIEQTQKLIKALEEDTPLNIEDTTLMEILSEYEINELELEIQDDDDEELVRSKILASNLHDVAMKNHLFSIVHNIALSYLSSIEEHGAARTLFLINKSIKNEKDMILESLIENQNYYFRDKESEGLSKTQLQLKKISQGFKKSKEEKDMKYVLYGREGGKKTLYSDYYNIAEKVIKNYQGDFKKRGTISRLVRLTNLEIEKSGSNTDIPTDKQSRTIIKKQIDKIIEQ